MHNVLDILLRDQSGATMVEYGLIVAGISVVILGALTLVGAEIANIYGTIATAVDNAVQN